MKPTLLIVLVACVTAVMSSGVTCRLATFEAPPDEDYSKFTSQSFDYAIVNAYEWDVTANTAPVMVFNRSRGCSFRPTSTFLNYTWMFSASMPCADVDSIFPFAYGNIYVLDDTTAKDPSFAVGGDAITQAIMVENGPLTTFFWVFMGGIAYNAYHPDTSSFTDHYTEHFFPEIHDLSGSTTTENNVYDFHLVAGEGLIILENAHDLGVSRVVSYDSPSVNVTHKLTTMIVHGLPTDPKAVYRAFVTDKSNGALTILAKDEENNTMSVYNIPQTNKDATVTVQPSVGGVSLPEYYEIVGAWNNGTTWFVAGSDEPNPGPKGTMKLVVLMMANDGSSTSMSEINELPQGVTVLDVICQ